MCLRLIIIIRRVLPFRFLCLIIPLLFLLVLIMFVFLLLLLLFFSGPLLECNFIAKTTTPPNPQIPKPTKLSPGQKTKNQTSKHPQNDFSKNPQNPKSPL